MVKTHWFVTQDQKQKIERWAKVRQTTESDIIRQLIDKNASK